jgi:hypothetical protein
MMEKCFDEGTIQAFLDGELSHKMVENLTHHIALCDLCAVQVATAEEEIEFAYSSIDNEFNNLVPTERLWTKINYSIEAEGRNKSVWTSILAFLTSPSAIGFASLLIVFGLFIGLYGLKNSADNGAVSVKSTKKDLNNVKSVETAALPVENQIDEPGDFTPKAVDQTQAKESEFTAKKAYLESSERTRVAPKVRNSSNVPDIAYPNETLAAEESYVRTISTLEKSVNSQKDIVMQPSARFAFEKDIAVADDTIKKMKFEVQKNPNNEAAQVLLRNSYQNKIDLLNSLAEKSELITSLN